MNIYSSNSVTEFGLATSMAVTAIFDNPFNIGALESFSITSDNFERAIPFQDPTIASKMLRRLISLATRYPQSLPSSARQSRLVSCTTAMPSIGRFSPKAMSLNSCPQFHPKVTLKFTFNRSSFHAHQHFSQFPF